MNTILINFADENMKTSQKLCTKSAYEKANIKTTYQFGPEHIDMGFYKFNQDILDKEQRGGGKGFWLWKPYFINQLVAHADIGDIIIYADSGVEFLKPVDRILDLMNFNGENIFLFGNNHNHFDYCKKEVAQHMLKLSDLQIKCEGFREQVQASVMFFKVNIFTRDFCKRWLAWSQIPAFINDTSAYQQLPNYHGHRNDQAILTNLAISENIKLHWWPVQYGHHVKAKYPITDNYGQLFYHHRYREEDWQKNGLTIEQFMNQKKS